MAQRRPSRRSRRAPRRASLSSDGAVPAAARRAAAPPATGRARSLGPSSPGPSSQAEGSPTTLEKLAGACSFCGRGAVAQPSPAQLPSRPSSCRSRPACRAQGNREVGRYFVRRGGRGRALVASCTRPLFFRQAPPRRDATRPPAAPDFMQPELPPLLFSEVGLGGAGLSLCSWAPAARSRLCRARRRVASSGALLRRAAPFGRSPLFFCPALYPIHPCSSQQ